MGGRDYDLKTILNIPLFEAMQDILAKTTGTAIITVDYKGTPVTRHSCRTEFCSVIRENPISRKRCFRCDALAGLEAVRLNSPFIYLCHCGIVDVAVPVVAGDRYLGAVMFGQVRIPDNSADVKVERLVGEITSLQREDAEAARELMEKYERIPKMEYRRVVEIAEMLEAIVRYIVCQAMDRRSQAMTYEWMLSAAGRQRHSAPQAPVDIGDLQQRQEGRQEPEPPAAGRELAGSPIYPAIRYLESHRQDRVTMAEMAELCHLAPSYFCRIFSRTTGETFVDYVNRQKVAWAKEMLRESEAAVSQVAAELGYLDTSYFIRVFKKYEGVTPLVYRLHGYR